MERLGVAARARSKAKIVAVTGSVGKTTAKEMLRAMLTACGATHASAASYNNHWGVPLTLARMPVGRALRRVRDGHESRGRNRAAHAHGAAACRPRDDDRPRPHRASRLDRSHRRREGRDLPRPRTSRNRGLKSRRSAVRAAEESRRGARREGLELWPRRRLRRPTPRGRGDRRRLARAGRAFSAVELAFELGAPGRSHGAERARRAPGGGSAWR